MRNAVLGWSRRQSPTAFDSTLGSLSLQLALVVLNGVAAGAFDERAGTRREPFSTWWGRRRLAARLRRRAPSGADTVIPVMTAERAARIATQARWLAGRAGLADDEAQRFAGRLSEILSGGRAGA
jgi:hypothetical protein